MDHSFPLVLAGVLTLAGASSAQLGTVAASQEISGSQTGRFANAVAWLGDLDGDGNGDLAVGASNDDDGGTDQGAVWILFLDSGGAVGSVRKISATQGGFGGDLDPFDCFGIAIAPLGDLDGDGITDIAVGACFDDDGDSAQGALWIVFLNADGTVRAEQKISALQGGFGGDLDRNDDFGHSVAALGDLNDDGVLDIAVGASGDSDTVLRGGALWIVFLNADGTVEAEQKINEVTGGFGGSMNPAGAFGYAVAKLGDLDGDGVVDLAVGAPSFGFRRRSCGSCS